MYEYRLFTSDIELKDVEKTLLDFNKYLGVTVNEQIIYEDNIVIGYTKTNLLSNPKPSYNYSIISGHCYEKVESTPLSNVEVILTECETNRIVDKTVTNDQGEFTFKVNGKLKYDISFKDLSNKYTGKYIDRITPTYDTEQPSKVYLIEEFYNDTDKEYYVNVGFFGIGEITCSTNIGGSIITKYNNYFNIKFTNIVSGNTNIEIYIDDQRSDGKTYRDTLTLNKEF